MQSDIFFQRWQHTHCGYSDFYSVAGKTAGFRWCFNINRQITATIKQFEQLPDRQLQFQFKAFRLKNRPTNNNP